MDILPSQWHLSQLFSVSQQDNKVSSCQPRIGVSWWQWGLLGSSLGSVACDSCKRKFCPRVKEKHKILSSFIYQLLWFLPSYFCFMPFPCNIAFKKPERFCYQNASPSFCRVTGWRSFYSASGDWLRFFPQTEILQKNNTACRTVIYFLKILFRFISISESYYLA